MMSTNITIFNIIVCGDRTYVEIMYMLYEQASSDCNL